jgi:hypothetical protein
MNVFTRCTSHRALGASHLARALHGLLHTSPSLQRLPPGGHRRDDLPGVVREAEVLGDLLGCDPASARQGGPVC